MTFRYINDELLLWVTHGRQTARVGIVGDGTGWIERDHFVPEGPKNYEPGEVYEGYAGIMSIIRRGRELFGFVHYEDHKINQQGQFDGSGFSASIGLIKSRDGGRTWERRAKLHEGSDRETEPGGRVSGAGQPNVLVKDGEVFMYYLDWQRGKTDEIRVRKAKLEEIENPEAWHDWDGQSFGGGVESESVVRVKEAGESYTALPQVSWNEHLGKYVMVYRTAKSFRITASTDGVTWENDVKVMDLHGDGVRFVSYPSLWTPGNNSDVTGEYARLFYASGSPHTMVSRDLKFNVVV
jgi:hypothetical protein